MQTVTQIEDAILATLQADEALAGYVNLFTPVPSLAVDKLTLLLGGRFPAIGVISGRGDYSYAIGDVCTDTGIFSMLCFNQNLRSLNASVAGGIPGEPGVWDMVEDGRRVLLKGELTGVTVLECVPIKRSLIKADDPFVIAALDVKVKWRV